MEYLDIRRKKEKEKTAAIRQIAASLKSGKVLVLPTDTIYGLSCRADDERAIARIYKLKGRDKGKPLLILISSLSMARKYVTIGKAQEEKLRQIWLLDKRPTSIILKKNAVLPESLAPGREGLALRLPKSPFLIKIIRKTGVPLVSTSFNISGQAAINDVSCLEKSWPKNRYPDLVVNGGPATKNRSSRLLDLSEGETRILRK